MTIAATPTEPGPAPADPVVAELRELQPWIHRLPPRARMLLEHRLSGRSLHETAAAMRLSRNAAQVGISGAIVRLRYLRTKGDAPPAPPRAPGTGTIQAGTGGWRYVLKRGGVNEVGHTVPTRDEAAAMLDARLAEPMTSDVMARARAVSHGKAKSLGPIGKLTPDEQAIAELAEYPEDVERPLTRAACYEMPRPCPFVSCSHHLYLDVNPRNGTIKLNFPHLEVWEMRESCSLDAADRGGMTLEEVGAILNLTRERIRQVEVTGLDKVKRNAGDELGLPPERDCR